MRCLIPLIAALVMLGGCSKKKKTLSNKQAAKTIFKSLKSKKMCCPSMSLSGVNVVQRGKVTKGRHAIRAKLFYERNEASSDDGFRIKHKVQATVECDVFKNKFDEWKAECKDAKKVPRSYHRVPYKTK